ncbi:MAG: hypothetical protein M1438_06705 [Deltaproteobacteria bacterium]|nr:hypothetical protein [Deltaproteobacteria bacterium]
MRRFPFLLSKHALALILTFNLVILGISIYLGVISAGQMRQIVKDDFNQQQLVLARHTASLMEQDSDFLERELSTLNVSPSIQYLEKLTWANRMRATLSSVREEGVVQIQRLDRDGTRAYLVDESNVDHVITGSFKDSPETAWARQPENKARIYVSQVSTQIPNYVGRLIMIMAVPTYEQSVDESHTQPSGEWSGVLEFYIDAQSLASKFTRQMPSNLAIPAAASLEKYSPRFLILSLPPRKPGKAQGSAYP